MSVKTLLFDGVQVDCNGKDDFFGRTLCAKLKESWSEYRLQMLDENIIAISVFGPVSIRRVFQYLWLE